MHECAFFFVRDFGYGKIFFEKKDGICSAFDEIFRGCKKKSVILMFIKWL